MIRNHLSIDLAGVWAARKAKRVIDALAEEAADRGLRIEMIDATMPGDRYPKVILHAVCIKHEWPVLKGAACELCVYDS